MIGLEQYRRAIGLGGFAPLIVRSGISVLKLGRLSLSKSLLLFLGLLLVMSGLETNPGPETRLDTINLDTDTDTQTEMDENTTTANQSPTNQDIMTELRNMRSLFTSDLNSIKEDLRVLKDTVKSVEFRTTSVEQVVTRLEDRQEDLESRMRRNNLLIYGIPDAKESWDQTEMKVRTFLKEDLELSDSEVNEIEIERTHRNGNRIGTRSIIVRFLRWKDSMRIFSLAKEKLRDSDKYVKQDFSQKIRETRRLLAPFYDEAVKKGHNPRVVMDKLVVNGIYYQYSPSLKTIVAEKR